MEFLHSEEKRFKGYSGIVIEKLYGHHLNFCRKVTVLYGVKVISLEDRVNEEKIAARKSRNSR